MLQMAFYSFALTLERRAFVSGVSGIALYGDCLAHWTITSTAMH